MNFLRHLVLFLLLFPPVAFADSTGWLFVNTGGTMTFNPTTNTLTLTSTITKIKGVGCCGVPIVETGSDLGTFTLTTGPLISGSIFHQALFAGGTLTIIVDTGISNGNGTLVPFTLSGTMNPLIWWMGPSGAHLAGNGVGIINGTGVQIWDFAQLAVPSGTPNQYKLLGGSTVIPEPGTVVLVVTGLGFLTWTKSRRRPDRNHTAFTHDEGCMRKQKEHPHHSA